MWWDFSATHEQLELLILDQMFLGRETFLWMLPWPTPGFMVTFDRSCNLESPGVRTASWSEPLTTQCLWLYSHSLCRDQESLRFLPTGSEPSYCCCGRVCLSHNCPFTLKAFQKHCCCYPTLPEMPQQPLATSNVWLECPNPVPDGWCLGRGTTSCRPSKNWHQNCQVHVQCPLKVENSKALLLYIPSPCLRAWRQDHLREGW